MSDKKIKINYRPFALVVLDGWGVAVDTTGNAITRAKKPVMDRLISSFPATTIISSGDGVGLRWGEMGNSEVGHLNIGAGTVLYQNLPRLNREISSGSFFTNKILNEAIDYSKSNKSKLHILGLLSSGGVHSHIEHLFALLKLVKDKKLKDVYLHLILDGRDSIYNSGKVFLKELNEKAEELDINIVICSMMGRFYAMDRDNRWDRTNLAYQAITNASGLETNETPLEYLESKYKEEVYDEQLPPVVFTNNGKKFPINDEDSLIFFNFRADRARQITKAIIIPHQNGIENQKVFKNMYFATMTEYEKNLPVHVAYFPIDIEEPLAKVFSDAGLKQLHIAETEKYAHVTFFINGGREVVFEGEDREVVPSPKVSDYSQKPQMSAKEITDGVLSHLQKDDYDAYIINYANPDMVAHTGDLKATIKAIEFVDKQIGRLAEAILAKNGLLIITADHGNAEEVLNLQTQDIDKEHSNNPVPLIIIAKDLEGKNMGLAEAIGSDLSLVAPTGLLADVAPTILKLLGLPQPKSMTGTSLL